LCEEALAIAIEGFEKPDTRWLFPAPPAPGVKDDLLRPYRLWKRLQDAKKATGIKNGKIHSFRHFFVSQAANSGVSPFKLMTIVGHKALDIILTYYHVDPDELLNAVHQIDFGVLTSPK
jgi:integrase